MVEKTGHDKAVDLLAGGAFEQALEILEKLEESPGSLNDRAAALHQSGRTAEALPLLDKALSISPEYMPAVLNRYYMRLAHEAAPGPPGYKVLGDWGPPPGAAPAVSVVIPTYDRPQFLKEAVVSALYQSFSDVEIVVVSDGGPPESENILREIGSDRIRYVRIDHGGISAALNAGVEHSRGKYIAYLDDDDVFYPNHLKELIEYLDGRPEKMIAYTLSWRAIQRKAGDKWETVDKEKYNTEPVDAEKLARSNPIQTTGSIMHRRELMDRVGYFNQRIIGCQDWEWYLRVIERYDMPLIDKFTLEHRFRVTEAVQLTAVPGVMRRNTNTVRFMRRRISIPSARPRQRSGYAAIMKRLAAFYDKWPEIIDVIDVEELANRKPYAFFFRLGKDLQLVGKNDMARSAYRAAFRLAPWEIKVWPKLL